MELSPVEAKFLGPVVLEVPHFGSLRDKEREIIILRSDNGDSWREHTLYDSDQDLLHIASFSDDRTVKLWDIGTEKTTLTFAEHEDYVRAGAVNPMSPDTLISGGYDGKIKMYDTRTQNVSFSIDHGSPVESLLFLPTGGIFISAGGTEMRVWDAFAGCRLLTKVSQHHKTITSLRLGSNGKRILSGSLDRHVKIYDVATYQTVHTLDFPNAVLSLGVAPGDQTVVAGMVDGLISIQNMEIDRNKEAKPKRNANKQRRLTSMKVDHNIRDEKPPNYMHI
ncbi:U3 small nucleolar RNA-associated protein 15 homolog [Rhagoletis pomonella]|uniref:U3 small nucleolar RNA-associated protein 15 homolog n=1 Tax=Rhagoletis pomonella TaxID=28610 RepID=UPI00177C19CB|nr:U3 small nucleolar RNA-associated protein 15 homolog [Rhagoletis pomonella]